jgi:predicted nucleic acid-binding protein
LELTLAQTLYTLDTNICSYILRRRPADFVEKLMIAAHAVACQSTLISSNVKEFERITGLRFDGWMLAL